MNILRAGVWKKVSFVTGLNPKMVRSYTRKKNIVGVLEDHEKCLKSWNPEKFLRIQKNVQEKAASGEGPSVKILG